VKALKGEVHRAKRQIEKMVATTGQSCHFLPTTTKPRKTFGG
jgi:hypothetical protein